MFISEEEHNSDLIVDLVHCIEIRDFGDIDEIDDREVAYILSNLVEQFVHLHALFVIVVSEADYDDAFFFGENSLVDLPAIIEMG